MSRLEVALLGKTLQTTGDILLRAELEILLETNAQSWEQVIFRVDSATEMTTMQAAQAKLLDLPLPANPVPGLKHAQTGQEIRAGFIRAHVVGMDGTVYVFPCYFIGDPHRRGSSTQPAMVSRNLLGLTGVVDKVRLTFDGKPVNAVAPYGYLVVEKQ